MKAICLRARGGPEALAYEEAPQPRPGEGEVLVRVHAAGVIHTELSWVPTWTTRAGEPRPLPVIPGHEFSGEIAALGAGVRGVGVGDPVYGLNDWYRDGAQAEYCVTRVADFAHKPAGVDHVHAAATPISALTAWQGLVERAGLVAGQRVLIHGAAGGVGTFAVQLARWRGARVTGTASAANLDFVRSLGADEVLDYRAERFEDVVRDVDVVFDPVGGETLLLKLSEKEIVYLPPAHGCPQSLSVQRAVGTALLLHLSCICQAKTSVPEWDRQFRLIRVHHEHREKLGRLRLTGIGADAVAVAGQLGEVLSGLVGRHRSVVDLTADRPLKHGRVDEGGLRMRVARRGAARAVFDEHTLDALAGHVR